jgi:hypothetical protein
MLEELVRVVLKLALALRLRPTRCHSPLRLAAPLFFWSRSMNRFVFSLFVCGLVCFVLSATAAPPPPPDSKGPPGAPGAKTPKDTCVKPCWDCAAACLECMKHSREMKMEDMAKECEVCHHACLLCYHAVGSHNARSWEACDLCEKVCTDCAASCEKGTTDHAKKCAKACQDCAKACAEARK